MDNLELITSEEAERLAKLDFNYFAVEADKLKETNPEYYDKYIYPIYEKYLIIKNQREAEQRRERIKNSNLKTIYVSVPIIVLIVLLSYLIGLVFSPDYSDYIEVSSLTLCKDYANNPVNADNIYKGKLLKVSGKISEINIDGYSSEYIIEIEAEEENMFLFVPYNTTIGYIKCRFNKSDSKNISNLRKHDKVSIIGFCKGMSGKYIYVYIDMERCIITSS